MIIIKKEQIDILRQYMKNIDELLLKNDLYEFELALDALIVELGFDDHDKINATGLLLQKLYDEIYIQND